MKKFAWTLLVSISFCFLSACGGGGGGDSSASSPGTGSGTTPPATGTPTPTPTPPATGGTTPTVLTGLFLDSAVVNIKYKTATQPGTTNALGQFNYVAGETVTFSVGSVTLPPTLAAATITPMSLANTTDMGNNTVLNLLVFLQSLDDDGIPGNGIKIPETAHAAATTSIDFNVSPAAFRSNPVFTALVANSGSAIKSPVTLASAIDHFMTMKETLAASNIVVQDPRPSAKIATVAETKVGNSIVLDGSASTDPKSASLSYNWTLIAPKGSRATLSKAIEAKPSFSIDISGDYVVSLVVDNGALTNSSKLTVKGIDNVFGSSNLYLYGKGTRELTDTVYVGCLTCDASQPDSICSADPASAYGITSSASSIWDVNSVYGDPDSLFSPWHFPGYAAVAPLVFNDKGDAIALFSVDKDIRDIFEKIFFPMTGGTLTTDPRAPAYLETLFATPNARPVDVLAALCGTGVSPSISAIQTVKKKQR